jgi:hypothetical protein
MFMEEGLPSLACGEPPRAVEAAGVEPDHP